MAPITESEPCSGRFRFSLLGLQNCCGDEVWLEGFDDTRNGFTFTFVLTWLAFADTSLQRPSSLLSCRIE